MLWANKWNIPHTLWNTLHWIRRHITTISILFWTQLTCMYIAMFPGDSMTVFSKHGAFLQEGIRIILHCQANLGWNYCNVFQQIRAKYLKLWYKYATVRRERRDYLWTFGLGRCLTFWKCHLCPSNLLKKLIHNYFALAYFFPCSMLFLVMHRKMFTGRHTSIFLATWIMISFDVWSLVRTKSTQNYSHIICLQHFVM